MSASGLRDLSPEERALVSGGAQMDTNDLPPVEVRPPDDWGPNPGPPDIIDPILDPGPGDNGGGGGGDDGDGSATDPSFAFVDVEPFKSTLTYVPGENGTPGVNKAELTFPIAIDSGQLTVGVELKFNPDGSFQDGKGSLNFVGNNGSLFSWELNEKNWSSTATGGIYWDLGGDFGFKLQMSYETFAKDIKGEAQFLYNKQP
jgi:hypothetical protein